MIMQYVKLRSRLSEEEMGKRAAEFFASMGEEQG